MNSVNLGKVKGTVIYSGKKITGNSSSGISFPEADIAKAYVGDIYINTDQNSDSGGNVYKCVKNGNPQDALWCYEGSILGKTPETIDNFKSTSILEALSANRGRILWELLVNSGVITKEVYVKYTNAVYGVKITMDNVNTTLTFRIGGSDYKYSHGASGTNERVTVTVPIGTSLGLSSSGGIIEKISSTEAYIYKCQLTDSSGNTVYTESINLWDAINVLNQEIEEEGTIVDSGTSLRTGKIYKIVQGIKRMIYPITHAKAVWYDMAANKTVADMLSAMITADNIMSREQIENATNISNDKVASAAAIKELIDGGTGSSGSSDAKPFDEETIYTAGQYCVQEGQLYKFTSDKPAGAWDETTVTAVYVMDEVVTREKMIAESADKFSESVDYSAGEYCINNDVLWKFIIDKPAGAWDASAVESTTVVGVLGEQNKNLGGFTPVIDEETGEITGYTTTIGGADTVFPFISNMSKLFSNYSFNSTNNVLNFNISAYSKIKYTCTSKVSTADINPFGVAKTVNGAGGSYMRLGEATGTYEVDVSAYKYLFIDVGYKSFPKFSEFRLIE